MNPTNIEIAKEKERKKQMVTRTEGLHGSELSNK